MADAFRGLTIRLGADARPLNSALASVKGAASAAQSQMNRLTRALSNGSTDAAAMSARMSLMSDKIALTAREAVLTETALSGVDNKIKQAVASGKNFYATTQQARMELKDTDRQLQSIHDALTSIVVKSDKYKDMSKDDAWKAARNEVKKLSSDINSSAEAATRLRNIAKSLKNGDIPFFNVGENNITRANKLISLMKELKTLRNEQDATLKSSQQNEEYAKQTYSLAAYNAELRKAIEEQTRFQMQWKTDASTPALESATNKLRAFDAATDAARNSTDRMTQAFREAPTSVEAAKAKLSSLKNEIAVCGDKASALKSKMSAMEDAGVNKNLASSTKLHSILTTLENDYNKITANVEKCENRIETLTTRQQNLTREQNSGSKEAAANLGKVNNELREEETRLSTLTSEQSKLRAKLDDATMANGYKRLNEELLLTESHISRLQNKIMHGGFLTNAARSIRTMGYGLYSTLTPAILIAGRYAVQAAEDVDSAYRDMRKTVNGSEEDFERLRDAALDFGSTHVSSADTILEIEAMGGQLGIAVENLESFAEAMSNLEVATDIDAEDISKYAGQLSNIMHDIDQSNPEQYTKDITSFSDALVRLGNNSAAQESSIMKVMMRIASLGEISGFSTPQLLAISTAVAATGQGCEAAGTAISKTFSNIQAAVSAGGDKLSDFAKVAGMSADEFAKSWKETPNDAFTAFIGGLTQIRKEGGDVDGTLSKLGINSVRQKQALEGLTNTFDVLTQSTKMSEDAWNGLATVMSDGKIEQAGDAAREAQAKAQGFSGQLKIMKNNAQKLGVQLLEGTVPILMALGDAFQSSADFVSKMPAPMKEFIVLLAGALAAAGPLAVAMGAVFDGISKIKIALETFQAGRIWKGITDSAGIFSRLRESIKYAGIAAELQGISASSKTASTALTGVGRALQFVSTTAGGIVVAASIAIIAKAAMDAYSKYTALKAATDDFTQATINSVPKIEASGSAIESAAGKAKSATVDYQALIEKQGQLAKTIGDRNTSAQAEIGILEDALQAIEQYANKTELTAEQHTKLKAAIEIVNDKLGTSYRLTNDVSGALANEGGAASNAAEEIRKLIQAKEEEIRMDALSEGYSDTYKQHLENVKALAAAQQKMNEENAKGRYTGDSTTRERGEWVEARNNLEEMKKVAEASGKSLEYYNEQLGNVTKAQEGAALSAGEFASTMPTLSMMFQGVFADDYANQMKSFCNALDDSGVALNDFKNLNEQDLYTLVDTWAKTGGNITDTLAAVGISVKSVGTSFTEAIQAAGGDVEGFKQIANSISGGVEKFAQDLQTAGISAQDFTRLGAEGFNNLWLAAGQSFNNLQSALALINATPLDPKTMQVTEDGIMDVDGKLWKLDSDAKTITDGERTFRIKEDGSVEEVKSDLEQIDNTQANATVGVEGAEEAAEETNTAEEAIDEYDGSTGTGYVNEEGSDKTQDAIEETDNQLSDLDGKNAQVYVYANDRATSVIDSVRDKLASLDGSSANVTVYESKVQSATGNIFTRTIRNIPKHADGGALNGIVTRATLTNAGWVGEAGSEAILNMKHAGGAIIPLSNRHYVRPFARAVAYEMGGVGGSVTNIEVNLQYSADADARQMARDLTRELNLHIKRGA